MNHHRDQRRDACDWIDLPTPRAIVQDVGTVHRRLAALEQEHAKCSARLRALHDQNTNLAQIASAHHLLANAASRDEVLVTVEEIVINMIGSEEIAIFDVSADSAALHLARQHGLEDPDPRLDPAMDIVRWVVATGDTYARRDFRADTGHGLTAVVPLKVESRVMGVVAIFHLLHQKKSLEPVDFEIFDIVSRQAAMALYAAAFRALRPTIRPPRRFEGSIPEKNGTR
jgi:hypothetical protein